MFRFYLRSDGPEDWRQALASPDKQWRSGYSAKEMAYCWEAAGGFPAEIMSLFADHIEFAAIEPLLGLVEHQVPMPGKGQPSQNDLFVLARANEDFVAIAIEGKASEPFGETLEEWNDRSPNKQERLTGICDLIGLNHDMPGSIRYQLLHRTASAVVEARRFGAAYAVMIVHSFSPSDQWYEDFESFVALYGAQAGVGKLVYLRQIEGINLYAGWAHAHSGRRPKTEEK